MSELALNDDQRDTLARHRDGAGVPELVRANRRPDAGERCRVAQLFASAAEDRSRPRVGPVRMQKSGPAGSATRKSSHC